MGDLKSYPTARDIQLENRKDTDLFLSLQPQA